jgi:hypothetical protein
MADDEVFDTEKCDVEPVEPIDLDNWLDDYTVPENPGDISDCASEPIPLPPPPLPDLPCPDFPEGGLNEIVREGEFGPGCPTQPTLTLQWRFIPDEVCGFDFELDLELETGCPVALGPALIEGQGSVVSGYENRGFTLAVSSTGCCSFELELDVAFPCPELTVGDVGWIGEGAVAFSIDPVGDCGFEFNLAVVFPDAAACVTLSVGEIETFTTPTPEGGSVDLEFVETGDCEFELSGNITFPVCETQVVVGDVEVIQVSQPQPIDVELEIEEEAPCTFRVNLRLFVDPNQLSGNSDSGSDENCCDNQPISATPPVNGVCPPGSFPVSRSSLETLLTSLAPPAEGSDEGGGGGGPLPFMMPLLWSPIDLTPLTPMALLDSGGSGGSGGVGSGDNCVEVTCISLNPNLCPDDSSSGSGGPGNSGDGPELSRVRVPTRLTATLLLTAGSCQTPAVALNYNPADDQWETREAFCDAASELPTLRLFRTADDPPDWRLATAAQPAAEPAVTYYAPLELVFEDVVFANGARGAVTITE